MFKAGKTAEIVKETKTYGADILGVSECRWTGFGKLITETGETVLYSGTEDNSHQSGVAFILMAEAAKSIDSWTPVNDRIITVRLHSKFIPTTIIQA